MKEKDSLISRRNFIIKGSVAIGAAIVIPSVLPEIVRGAFTETADGEIFSKTEAPEATPEVTAEGAYRPGEAVRRGNRSEPRVFLTVDPGGSERNIDFMMDSAERNGAKITFFPTGKTVKDHLSFWTEVISRGHEVGNHTWSHPNLKRIPGSEIRTQLLKQREIVQRAAAMAGINDYQQVFMRPPYGSGMRNPNVISVCQDLNYVIAMWTSDRKGYRSSTTPDMIVQGVSRDLSNGLIILQHSNPRDTEAFPRIVRMAKDRGYAVDKTLRDGISTTIYP